MLKPIMEKGSWSGGRHNHERIKRREQEILKRRRGGKFKGEIRKEQDIR